MNAIITRNCELLSIRGFSRASSRWGGEVGRPPRRHSVFFVFAKSVTFQGVFLIDVIYFKTWAQYHPFTIQWHYTKTMIQ